MEHLEQLLGLEESRRSVILDNIAMIELNSGCSVGCDFCQFAPSTSVGNFIPFSVLEQLAAMLPKNRRLPIKIYWGTDPFDWQDGSKSILDVVELLNANEVNYVIKTAIPENKEDLVLEALKLHEIEISTARFLEKGIRFKDLPPKIRRIIKHQNARIMPPYNVRDRVSMLLYAGGRAAKRDQQVDRIKQDDDWIRYGVYRVTGRLLTAGITSMIGVFITPRGVYNKTLAPFSKDYPRGEFNSPIDISNPEANKVARLNTLYHPDTAAEAISFAAFYAWLAYPDGPFVEIRETRADRLTEKQAAVKMLETVLSHPTQLVRCIKQYMAAEYLAKYAESGNFYGPNDEPAVIMWHGLEIGETVTEQHGTKGLVALRDVLPIYLAYWNTARLQTFSSLIQNDPDLKKARQFIQRFVKGAS